MVVAKKGTHLAQVFYGLPPAIYGEDSATHYRVVKWLDKSYIGSRYKPEFVVSKEVFHLMHKGIDNLFVLAAPRIYEIKEYFPSPQCLPHQD